MKARLTAAFVADLLRRTRAAERDRATLSPLCGRWHAADAAVEFGPRYSPRSVGVRGWRDLKRLRRAVDRLRACGLVELVGCARGRRLASVRFTPAGRAAAERSVLAPDHPLDRPGR